MNVKKRPRLELATAATTTTPTPLTTTATTTTDVALYGNVNGNLSSTTNGLFLTSSVVGGMGMGMGDGAQIYLTICGDDDNSNESQEFYAIESIKQEPDLDALHAAHCMLPTNLQLPTGCEIYLVKDNTTATAAATTIAATTTTANKINHSSHNNEHLASIKLEPDSTNVLFMSGGGGGGGNNNNSSNGNLIVANKDTAAVAPSVGGSGGVGNYNVKLDAYKKRDDKRRATHNEVERRRRDKINCWIFKLKEMLPTDGNRYKPTTNSMADSLETTTTTATATTSPTTTSSSSSMKSNPNANGSANGRTPPNDSKSQILIKACDYIKSMQNEIDNLRDCLREAESLRLSNQALRDELQHLKQQQELQERFNTAGGSFNVTLNSLNSSATSDLFDGIDTAPNLSTVSSINFTKRGLIIADYDE